MPRYLTVLAFLTALIFAGCAGPQETVVVTDRPEFTPGANGVAVDPEPVVEPVTVEPGRFDFGKMWTFDSPPLDYFAEEYGFTPTDEWFDHARLGALRFSTYCSASFVSPNGLLVTNNHCARESVEKVSGQGEDLLENGFYASTLEQERRVEDLHVDQLISIEDVTSRITQNLDRIQDAQQRAQVRQQRIEDLTERLTAEAQRRDSAYVVDVISLYQGGRYAAYTFRRYDDVRLTMSTEHRIGYFGGDYDNFTYPRYNLDYAFFRAYDDSGQPLRSEPYFRWNPEGASAGEVVFVVGSPGSTSRLKTVAQLEYERDFEMPAVLEAIERRADIFADVIEADPQRAEEYRLRSTYLSLTNQIKAQRGQLEGLRDPYLIARRRAAEREMRNAIQASDTLREQFSGLFDQIAELQRSKEGLSRRTAAFAAFGSIVEAQAVTRALYGYIHSLMRQRGFPQESIDEIMESARETEFYPEELEVRLLTARLEELRRFLGPNDPTVEALLGEESPEAVAQRLISTTALIDSLRFEERFETGFLRSGDSMVEFINTLGPVYLALAQQTSGVSAREEVLTSRLGRARLAIHGDTVPPDASFSLRIADGRVQGYPYNGTFAPPFTTFSGMYDRFYSFSREDWELPERWVAARDAINLSVPVNLVSTNDITGGNSGSPLLNQNLEIVGVIFDSNIDALPNEFIYLDERPRAISVDGRGILESLRVVYDAHPLLQEILTGRLEEVEVEAASP